MRIRIIAEVRSCPRTSAPGLFGLCIFMKLTSMKNGLPSLACFLMYLTAESACRTSKVAR